MMRGFVPIIVIVVVGLSIVVGGGGLLLKEKTDEQKSPVTNRSLSQTFKDILKKEEVAEVLGSSPSPANLPSVTPNSQAQKPTSSPKIVASSKPTPTPVPTPSPSPTINSVSPSSAKYSDTITIRGSLLGFSTGQVVIESSTSGGCCGGPIESWSDSEIRAKVPALAKGDQYKVKVITSSGKVTNQLSFTISAG